MKAAATLLLTLLLTSTVLSQQRVMITPQGEAIFLNRGESAIDILKKEVITSATITVDSCSARAVAGRSQIGTTNFGYGQGDVCLMRLVAPVTGVVESLYFVTYLANAEPDSSCSIRIFRSNITNASPGPPGIVNWGGYMFPTDSLSVGHAPYRDIRGIDTNFQAHTSGAFDPNGAEIWGNGGYVTTWHRGNPAINGLAMNTLGYEPHVMVGEAINVNIRNSQAPPIGSDRTEMLGLSAEPLNFLKFYYRPRSAGDTLTWGWWRREYEMCVWAVIRYTPLSFNVPPLGDVLDTLSRRVCFAYCDSVLPDIDSVFIKYSVNNGEWRTVRFRYEGGQWCAVIPGQPPGSIVVYSICAARSGLNTICISSRGYRIVDLNRDGYATTYNAPYSFVDITGAGGGTEIPVNAFFNTSGPNDDGTAGPFDIGGIFQGLFGRMERYAWIGVNGAICLSNSPTDTVRVGNGYSLYNVPTTAAPKNFIGAFWNDFIIGTGGNGSIWYKVSGTQFIVQWNHIGNFNAASDTLTTFEMILDRGTTPQTITFQYQNVGITTLPTDGVIALQDTVSNTSKYVYINRSGYPSETRARNLYAIKLAYTGPTDVQQPGGESPLQYSLSANYPNPFNPSTTIRYELPQATHVTLRVFNVLGQEVATLVNEVRAAGIHSVQFSGENLASGVYLCQMEAGTFSETRKLLLMH